MKKNNNFKKIYKLIITLVIIYFVVSSLLNFFSKAKDRVENVVSNYTNSFVENHQVEYELNTDSDNTEVEVTNSEIRDKYTKLLGNGDDEVTIMVYMIGTDLESNYGMATKDINEMIYGKTSDNTNLVIQTGGCKNWNNTLFADGQVERWVVNSGEFLRLKNPGKVSMTDPDQLSDFIRYSAENFPANRYILILWDHGGGSESGYGYDENYPNSSLTPADINKALNKANVKFDIVGFDACLMANLETAIAIEPYADYMIASEESEPGEGWYYTNFVKMLEDNTSISSLTLGKQIVDDYISTSKSSAGDTGITQSMIDLGELVYNIKQPISKFSSSALSKLEAEEYKTLATARSNTKEFSKSSYLDQVDLVDLANKFDLDGSKELVEAVKSAVKYNKTYAIENAYGISVYFPYAALSKVNSMVEIYDDINMDSKYSGMVKSFATYLSSGHIVTQNYNSTGSSLFDILTSDNYYYESDYDEDSYYDLFNDSYHHGYEGYDYEDSFGYGYDEWMEPSAMDLMSLFFRNNPTVNPTALEIKEKNNQRVVSLSDDEWKQISNVTLNVFIDDGEGYLDLGKDNIFEWNNEGDLIVDHDGTWLAINDSNVVSYQFVSDMYIDENNYKTVGYIPAYLNDKRVNLIVNFTPENPYGIILGGQLIYDDSDMLAKGLIEIKQGDEIRFICNYYKYDGTFVDEYQIGEPLIVVDKLELANVHLDNKYLYAYCFEDIYNNKMWTPKTIVD